MGRLCSWQGQIAVTMVQAHMVRLIYLNILASQEKMRFKLYRIRVYKYSLRNIHLEKDTTIFGITFFFEQTDLANTTSFLPLCSVDAATIALPHKRVVSFIEPDKNNLAGFLNCLEIMSPLRVDFALDNNPIQDNAPRSGDVINKYTSEGKGLPKNLPLNVIVYGKKI